MFMDTITLEVGQLDEAKGGYPLLLYAHTERGREAVPTAEELIPQNLDIAGKNPQEVREFLLNENETTTDFRDIGRALFHILNQGQVGKCWAELRKKSASRTFLDIQDRSLSLLPWELLCEGEARLMTSPKHVI